MENGRFTREEREYLLSLDAVDEVRASSIVYSKAFKEEFMRRYLAGEGPGAIFASAGMPSSLVGYKRIERAAYHWREAAAKGALTATDAPGARHRAHVDRLRREKREAVARQREIREREVARERARTERQREIRERRVAEAEGKLARQRERGSRGSRPR